MLISMGLFGLFSALCGASATFEMLVLFRILQGMAAGPLMPMSQTLLMSIFPPEKRPVGISIWMMTTVLAPVLGPIVGGNFADTIGWHWAFLINVPIVMLAVVMIHRIFRTRELPTRPARFDFVGIALLVVWVGSMQILLDTGRELSWFDSPFIRALAAIAVIGFAVFVVWELTEKDPAVNLRLFRSRNFTTAATLLAVCYAVFFGTNVLLPLWLQTNIGYTATWAGLAVALSGLSAAAAAPLVARLMTRIDPRFLLTFAVVWLALMAYVRATLPPDANFWAIAAPQMLQGIAMPCMFIPLNQMALAELNQSELPGGSGLTNFMRTTAGAFATSMVTTLWDNAAVVHRTELDAALAQGTIPVDSALAAAAAATGTAPGSLPSLALIDRILENQAVMVATSHMFALSVAMLVVVLPAIWLLRRPAVAFGAGTGQGSR
jgi:DHA2 family multidrug resistance protein